MNGRKFDGPTGVKELDTKENAKFDLGAKVSEETQKALKAIDANIRNAELKSGSLLVA